MKYITNPNLPQRRVVHALLSIRAGDEILMRLRAEGVIPVSLPACVGLAPPVDSHADLLVHPLGGALLAAARGVNTCLDLSVLGFRFLLTKRRLKSDYPECAALDAARIGNTLICNPRVTDPVLMSEIKRRDVSVLPVRQGYAKCSVCVVDDHSLITSDEGIALAAEGAGFDVLRIRPGYINLQGYSYGFIGGCSGKLSPDRIAFTGNLRLHPDYERMESFLTQKGVQIVVLSEQPLIDIGGILPLTEEGE